ncbi:hypothetical protein Gogos_011646 [Gossypium gossypioides]|uniref:Carboxypeptidase n=1 Tax=Gossypium gossypioides TaxID=34282 RepID=A0A7J9BPZ4_GOSGO|nr:hypothetical protein [Gossypium gossypioides]
MKVTIKYLLLVLSYYFTTFLISCKGNQISNLNRLIESRKSPHPESWALLNDQEDSHNSPVYVGSQKGMMQSDKINALPGQPEGVDFDQYAGYVTVDPIADRALFYYFVESPQNPSDKPLENFAVANVIFLEFPAGVGFSYSNDSSDHTKVGDKRTTKDSYVFHINWLERFPQYKRRDFFITGESYAGHYVPQLAYYILSRNKNTNQTVINLKGIAIGNAWIDDAICMKGMFDYLWTHALNSDETDEGINNGDTDGRVPVTSSRYAIKTLELPVETAWRPWYSNSEVGGYVVGYKGVVFTTVRGAGHTVPSYQPERALTMITSFLNGKLPPDVSPF